MDNQIRQRLVWVEMYAECGDAGFVCRRCGISRPTLRKWSRRYAEQGLEWLVDQSRRPHCSPSTKVGDQEEKWILSLRKTRKLGARRIKNELCRQHNCSLALASIHKVLTRNDVKPFKRRKLKSEYIINSISILMEVEIALAQVMDSVDKERELQKYQITWNKFITETKFSISYYSS